MSARILKTFEDNHHPERIRLSGIDCPEEGQAYGKRAKQTASELVFGQKSCSTPSKGGQLILFPDDIDVNHTATGKLVLVDAQADKAGAVSIFQTPYLWVIRTKE